MLRLTPPGQKLVWVVSFSVTVIFYNLVIANDGDEATKMVSHLLFETASGYAIFEAKLHEDIGSKSKAVQDSIQDLAKFGKMVSLISFSPFKNAAEALQNANDISEGQDWLRF
jgi:hypothetical protein